MNPDLNFWHNRFSQQVGWSLPTRRFIFDQLSVPIDASILEVGCGTGALLESLRQDGYQNLFGLDIVFESLIEFRRTKNLLCGDANTLPFRKKTFDLVICHYLLLWVSDPIRIIQQMAKATKPMGWVISLSEPDYSGRIDLPYEFIPLGELQTKSLRAQGAKPSIGRHVQSYFREAGLKNIHNGIIGASRKDNPSFIKQLQFERQVLREDLRGMIDEDELEAFFALEDKAILEKTRELYVPVFFTYAQVA